MHQPRKSVTKGHSCPLPTGFVSSPIYSHVSTYHSLQMELQLYSQSVKVPCGHMDSPRSLPVFGEHDQITGKIILNHSYYHAGRLSISIEGALMHTPTPVGGDNAAAEHSWNTGRRRHVFFSPSTILAVSPSSALKLSRPTFRHALRRDWCSLSDLDQSATPEERSFPFTFELPSGREKLPPSSTDSLEPESRSQSLDIIYTVNVAWEAYRGSEMPRVLKVPILIYPDTDFQSSEAMSQLPQCWLEMPLTSERPVPFSCAITLPTSATFTRTSSIPYFVVFTTIPRSPELAKEIAADATISVSLVRQVTVTEGASLQPSPPDTLPGLNDEYDTPRTTTLLNRVRRVRHLRTVKPTKGLGDSSDVHDESYFRLPLRTVFSESHTLQNRISVGFPKRPRRQICDPRSHPSLNSQVSLPDGLYKSEIRLHKEMLPSIYWAGVSIKYYLDVSVLVGQDNLRARVPMRIV